MMEVSGLKVTRVPVLRPALPAFASGALGMPQAYSCCQVKPSRQISSSRRFGKRVDAADAHAVQAARNFVALGIEFAAGMQFGHDDLRGGDAFVLVQVHRNAAAVVDDGDRIVDRGW